MSASFTSFAIVGAGGVGRVVAGELLKKGLQVTIVTRDDSRADLQELKSCGAVLAKVDYADQESIKEALAGIEAVVTALGPLGLATQFDVIRAAKAAGVKLFVPAEYGVDVTDGLARGKKMAQELLKQLDLPYTLFFCGLFYEVLPMRLGHNYAEGTMQIVGDGNTKFSLTAREDVGKFVAHVVSTAPPSALKWAKIPFEGDRKSPLEIASLAEKRLGKKMALTFVDYEQVKAKYDTDFASLLLTVLADGRGVSGTDLDVKTAKTKFFPEWNPTPYEAVIQ